MTTWWSAAGAALMVATALTVVPAASADPAPAAHAGAPAVDGLRLVTHTTYTFDAAALVVHVRHEASLENTTPDRVEGAYVNRRYFPEMPVVVVAEATAMAATKAGGTPLAVSVEPTESPFFALALVDLAPDLYYPSSQSVTLTYDIPAVAPRSEAITRINEAFATFPVYTPGDPGTSTVEVVVPESFDVEVIGGALDEERRDGTKVLTSGPIQDPEAFWVNVVARDDERLVHRTVDLGRTSVEVQGWPGDTAWADFVAGDVEAGIPALEDLIGSEWPVDGDLDIVETVAPYLYGYAGWYAGSSDLIEIGDELDSSVVLHELAHAWFNDDLFRERWISEGLADTFTLMALEQLGKEARVPQPVRPDDPGRLRLNAWGTPDLEAGDTDAQETYGYNTSFSLLHAVAEEVGPEAMTAVTTTAIARQLPYTSELAPGVLAQLPTWQNLLDLLEEVGGSTTAEQRFRDLVVTDEQRALLDERRGARAAYADLEADSDGWAPPRALRRTMSEWDFEDVDDLVIASRVALAQRDELADALADVDLEVPESARFAYEASRDLDDLADELDDATAAGEALRDAVRADQAGAGPLGFIGLLGSGADDELDDALAAMDAGKWRRAEAAAASVDEAYGAATVQGLLRLLGLVLLVGGLVVLVRWIRRRRAARATARAEAVAADDLDAGASIDAPEAAEVEVAAAPADRTGEPGADPAP